MPVHMIQILGDWGYGLKFQDLQKIVGDYLIHTNQTHLFKNGRPGVDWYNHFKNRWSNEISSRIATNLTKNRAASCTPEIIEKYFETCQRVYSEAEIDRSKSSHVWNVDETGFSGDTGEETILLRKGSKSPIKMTINNEKIHYVVQNCCNADGYYLPPFIVYKCLNRLYSTWIVGRPENAVYATSQSGWMEEKQFVQ